jgi:hypothetical protein
MENVQVMVESGDAEADVACVGDADVVTGPVGAGGTACAEVTVEPNTSRAAAAATVTILR